MGCAKRLFPVLQSLKGSWTIEIAGRPCGELEEGHAERAERVESK